MRFTNRAKQCHAAHIQRAWLHAEDFRTLDESKENYRIYLIKHLGCLLLTANLIFRTSRVVLIRGGCFSEAGRLLKCL